MEQMSNGNEFDIKESGQMTEQYNLICIKWENEASRKAGEILEYLTDLKERGYVGNDEKLLLTWLMGKQSGLEENKVLLGYKQQIENYK